MRKDYRTIRVERENQALSSQENSANSYARLKRVGVLLALISFWVLVGIYVPQYIRYARDIEPFLPNMIFVEGGSFMMGCSGEQYECCEYEVVAHKASVPSFYISQKEVSFNIYDAFSEATNRGDDYYWLSNGGPPLTQAPLVRVTWYDAIECCNWLSITEGLEPCYTIDKSHPDPYSTDERDRLKWRISCDFSKNGYRLPTETEWEYAARGGQKSEGYIYAGTSDTNSIHLYANGLGSKLDGHGWPAPMGSFRPNELGLYDMTGNVYEMCWSSYTGENLYTDTEALYKPTTGAVYSEFKVLRGGSFFSGSLGLRISTRWSSKWVMPEDGSGFRVVRTP